VVEVAAGAIGYGAGALLFARPQARDVMTLLERVLLGRLAGVLRLS
jgi:hypothetical protein